MIGDSVLATEVVNEYVPGEQYVLKVCELGYKDTTCLPVSLLDQAPYEMCLSMASGLIGPTYATGYRCSDPPPSTMIDLIAD